MLLLVLKIIFIVFMLFLLLRMLTYFRIQVSFYLKSRHIQRFLDSRKMSAREYVQENHDVWAHNFRLAPYLRGGGTRAFVAALLWQARHDLAVERFNGNEKQSLICFSCYMAEVCNIRYDLCCDCCSARDCGKKENGRATICGDFHCRFNIESD